MNLVLGSCFRNSSAKFVETYFQRIAALRNFLNLQRSGHALHLLLVWGDSSASLRTALEQHAIQVDVASAQVIERSHGLGDYGSSTHPDRLKGFAYAANGVFEAVGEGADVVIYVESDLIWTPETLWGLVEQLRRPDVDVLGPMTMAAGDTHYDFWAWRDLAGEHIGALPPYFQDGRRRTGLVEVAAGGSCLVLRGAVARSCRCTDEEALVGFCKQARQQGYRIWFDVDRRIQHP